MAEQRQLTGVMATVLDQRPEGFTVYKAVTGLDAQGKITPSGLITVPISSGNILRNNDSENPSIVAREGKDPKEGETKEAALSKKPINPLWYLAGALLLL